MVQKGESRLSKVLIYNLLTIMGIFYFKIQNKMLYGQETIIRLITIIFLKYLLSSLYVNNLYQIKKIIPVYLFLLCLKKINTLYCIIKLF